MTHIPGICHTLARETQREKGELFGAWWRACLRREPFHRIPSTVPPRRHNRGPWPPQLRTRYTESSWRFWTELERVMVTQLEEVEERREILKLGCVREKETRGPRKKKVESRTKCGIFLKGVKTNATWLGHRRWADSDRTGPVGSH